MPLFSKGESPVERDLAETILLISRLNDADAVVTEGIRQALIRKEERALSGLIPSLASPNGLVRETCVEILGEIASPRAVAPLVNLLYDYREDIPPKVERALRKIVDKHLRVYEAAKEVSEELANSRRQIIEPLVNALSNPVELLRMGEVVRLLIELKNEATRAFLKIYSESGHATKEYIKAQTLRLPENKKTTLLTFAGSFKNREAQLLVIELLNSIADRNSLQAAVKTLIEQGNISLELKSFCRLKGLTKLILEELAGLNSETRWQALSYLEHFTDDSEVINAVKKRLKDPEKKIRQRALLILGNLEDGFDFEPLVQALDDANEDIQISALRMLARQSYPGIISLLIKMSVRSKNLNAIALSELAQISPHDYTQIMSKMNPAQQEELRRKLEEFNLDIMTTLKKELHELDVNKRLKAAQAIQVIGLAVNIDKDYISSLADPDERVRATLVRTIGAAGNTMALSAILRTLTDPDRRVRANAVETYAQMRDPELLKRLISFLQDPDNRVRGNVVKVLIEMGFEPAFNNLLEMLRSGEELMRLSALWVVSELKEKRAKDAVAKLSMMDQSPTVRKRATDTLKRLGGETK